MLLYSVMPASREVQSVMRKEVVLQTVRCSTSDTSACRSRRSSQRPSLFFCPACEVVLRIFPQCLTSALSLLGCTGRRIGGVILATMTALFVPHLVVPAAFSGEYVLVQGKGVDVCEAYEENLNSFKDLPYEMVCDRLLNPKLKGLKKPVWKQLDAWQNREVIHKISLFSWGPSSKETDVFLRGVDKAIKERESTLYEAYIDIDNDGNVEHVYRNDYAKCNPAKVYSLSTGRYLVVWNDEKNAVNTGLLKSACIRGSRRDVFIYKGEVYLDLLIGNPGLKDGGLYVFRSCVQICEYRYKAQPTRRKGE